MKDKILKISKKLENGEISEVVAQRQLLILFGVDIMIRRFRNYSKIYGYVSKSFKQKVNNFIHIYC